MSRRTVVLSIANTFSIRNILRTGVFAALKEAGYRIVLLAPFIEDEAFRREFEGEGVVFERLVPYQMTRLERVIDQLKQGIFLGHSPTSTVQLFLEKSIEEHGGKYRLKKLLAEQVLGRLSFLAAPLARAELTASRSPYYEDLLERHRPSVVCTTRTFYCEEVPLIRNALRKGITTMALVASWDNLTNKGALPARPHKLVVWNEVMRQEAVCYHRYRPEDVFVTGAPHHDFFAGFQTRFSREGFCRLLGADPGKALLTYATEPTHISTFTEDMVELLCQAVQEGRFHRPCQLLLRVHPRDVVSRYDRFRGRPGVIIQLAGRPMLPEWMDISSNDQQMLAETLIYSDVILNVTSTITIDAAIFDRPVVCLGFSGRNGHEDYFSSPRRYFDYTHFNNIVRLEGFPVVHSQQELIGAINRYLDEPSLDRAGRRRIVEQQCPHLDGRCARRVAEAVMAVAGRP